MRNCVCVSVCVWVCVCFLAMIPYFDTDFVHSNIRDMVQETLVLIERIFCVMYGLKEKKHLTISLDKF
jgi:hypothetical protein